MGTRSTTGSANTSAFGSPTQTAAHHGAKLIDMFRAFFRISTPRCRRNILAKVTPECKIAPCTTIAPVCLFVPHLKELYNALHL
jgi:hypothetical protein